MRLRKRELVELRILDSEEELHGGHGLLVSNLINGFIIKIM